MSEFLDEAPAQHQSPEMRAACPSCGVTMQPGAVICMQCGYNSDSGKAINTKAKSKAPGEGITNLAGNAGAAALAPVFPLIGACVAGAIGASAWAALAYFANLEHGILAWAIGGLVGFGAVVGAKGNGNVLVGLMAAVVAIVSILAGKYAVVNIYVNQYAASYVAEAIDVEEVLDLNAYDMVTTWIEEDRTIEWPNPNVAIDLAGWPDDYPQDLQDATREKWNSLSPEEQQRRRNEQEDEYELEFGWDDGSYTLEDWIHQIMVDEIAQEWIDDSRTIDWDDSVIAYAATWPDDYPSDLRDAVRTDWNTMSPDEQQSRLDEIQQERAEFVDVIRGAATNTGFIASFSLFDILFFLLAVITAFRIGAMDD